MRALIAILALSTTAALANESHEGDIKKFLLHYRLCADGGYAYNSNQIPDRSMHQG